MPTALVAAPTSVPRRLRYSPLLVFLASVTCVSYASDSSQVTCGQFGDDEDPPIVTFHAPPSAGLVAQTVQVRFTISDDCPLTTATLGLGLNPLGPSDTLLAILNNPTKGTSLSHTWDTTTWPNGPAYLNVSATDNVGNQDVYQLFVQVSNP